MAKKKGPGTALATRKGTAMADAPAHIVNAIQKGNENVGSDDLTIPRLVLLQDMSDEVKKKNAAYVEGAEPGHIMNSVTKELTDEVRVINLYQRKEFPVFVKRDAGGGFRGSFASKAEAEEYVANQSNKNNLEVIETANHFCLTVDEDGQITGQVVIPMTSSKLGFARSWNSMIIARGGPRYGSIWVLTKVEQTNAKGTFWNFTINQPAQWVDAKVLAEAERQHELVAKMPAAKAA